MKRYLVFDWGGTSLKYAYMSEDGQIIQKNSVSSPARSATKEEFYAVLDSVVNQFDDISGIAISSSGWCDWCFSFLEWCLYCGRIISKI